MTSRNLKNFEFKLGKLGLTIFVVSMSTLLFAVFILGVMVGRDADNLPGKVLTDLPGGVKEKAGATPANPEQQAAPQSTAREGAQEASMERQPDMNLTFYDTLARKKADEKGIVADKDKSLPGEAKGQATTNTIPPVAQKANPVATTPASVKKPDVAAADKNKKALAKQPEKKQIPDKTKAAAKKQQERASSSTAKALEAKGLVVADVGGRTDKKTNSATTNTVQKKDNKEKQSEAGKKYLIQVASYKEKGKSELIGKKLKMLGYKSSIVAADLGKKGKWYRVFVTGFDSKEKATKAAGKITGNITGTNCIVRAANGPAKKNSR